MFELASDTRASPDALQGSPCAGLRLTQRLLLAISILLCSTFAPAQQETEQTSPADPAGPALVVPGDSEPEDLERGSASLERAPENSLEGSLDNYEASEQISEDLSVSFPVDI